MAATSSSSPLARLAGAVAVFTWLVVPFQLHLVNYEGWSPLFFLWLGVGGSLVLGLFGAAVGWLLDRLRSKVPGALLLAAAVVIPAGVNFFLFMWKVFSAGAIERRSEVVGQGTVMAFVLAAAGLVIALLLHRRWRAPLPTVAGVVAAYLGVALLAREPQPELSTQAEVEQELLSLKGAPTARRLLVFGADGLEWRVLHDLIGRGELPNFEALIARAATAPYQTMEPTLSPIIWNTMATGLPWEEHGVREFVYYALPGTREDLSLSGTVLQPFLNRVGRDNKNLAPYIRLAGSAHRHRLAFWQILDLARMNTAVVNWWATHPPGDTAGVIVSDQAVELCFEYAERFAKRKDWVSGAQALLRADAWMKAAVKPESDFALLSEEFEPAALEAHFQDARELLASVDFGLEEDLPPVEEGAPPAEPRLPSKQVERFARALIHGELVRELLERDEQEVYVFYDRLTDQISHLYWQFYQPDDPIYGDRGPTPEAVAGLGDMVPAAYRTADRILGRLVEAAGDDANVLVVSDHGFSAIHPPNRYEWGKSEKNPPRSGHHHHGEPGVFILAGPQVCPPADPPKVGILDFAPTVLYLRGLPVAQNMPGRPVTEVLCPEWVASHPVASVPTFEYPGWRERGSAAVASADKIADLEELGYLAGGGEEQEAASGSETSAEATPFDVRTRLNTLTELAKIAARPGTAGQPARTLLEEASRDEDPEVAGAASAALKVLQQ